MKYPLSSRVLHWLMATIILFMLGLGIYMTDFLSKESPSRMDIYNLHKSLGVLVLALIVARIINRVALGAPAMPKTLLKSEKILAHLAHGALYLLMILVPLSGYLMSNLFGYPVKFFSIELPSLVTANPELGMTFAEIHEVSAFILLGIVAIHILAVVKHRFFDKPENDVLNRMI